MKERTSVFANQIESFIDSELVSRPDPLFFEMEALASSRSIPIVTPATGAVLKTLFSSWNCKKIWELGTGIGYSTLWIALGSPNAEITTIDRNPDQASIIETYAEKILQKLEQRPRRISAWVLDYMYENVSEWKDADAFFIDCDKVTYPELWDLISHHVAPGTKILYDNVLWHGRLMDPSFQKPSDLAVRALWERVKKSDFDFTLFPVGDGILLTEKR